ncbi:MAG: response regulator transcription factor [Arachnia sp.]
MARVLVVDDDPTVRQVVVEYLSAASIDSFEADSGPAALQAAWQFVPDLVVLDLSLPGMDGLEVFRRLRLSNSRTAVIMLTARGEEPDRILGFEIGADDYVAKPFSPRELMLRVQSVLRRLSPDQPTRQLLREADLTIDLDARSVTRADKPLTLTAREFDLLVHLITHPRRAFTRDDLVRDVWGWQYGDQSTVTVHVRRLREKVEADPSHPTRLVTVWGVGYRWDPHHGS